MLSSKLSKKSGRSLKLWPRLVEQLKAYECGYQQKCATSCDTKDLFHVIGKFAAMYVELQLNQFQAMQVRTHVTG